MTRAEGAATGAITQCGETNRLVLVDTLRVHGAILTRQGRWIEAGAALEKAITVAHRMPYPYATARALYQHGLLHIERCEAGPAQVRLQEALHIFQRLGAYPYMEQTDRALARLP